MILVGDCLDVLRTLDANSVDAIVTDPPYGLSFMGKRWDYDVPSVDVWSECLRVLKPGGHLLAFAGTRTQHRMAVRIEDAGFEIRDLIAWVYGSGFPKSHNGEWGGTALKPALEPITVARKPLIGTVAQNWQAHGTGALNIDGCRVGTDDTRSVAGNTALGVMNDDAWQAREVVAGSACGRWPANLIHDGSEDVLAGFPSEAGAASRVRGTEVSAVTANTYGERERVPGAFHNDSGSAARFFYCAKASRSDRNDGCEHFTTTTTTTTDGRETVADNAYQRGATERHNHHPTVKPTELMRYLCRLVTPPGGLVLDPFAGSGSTGRGALLEGFRFIGIEREVEYALIAEARLAAVRDRMAAEAANVSPQTDLFAEVA